MNFYLLLAIFSCLHDKLLFKREKPTDFSLLVILMGLALDELYRLLDKRMHVHIIIDERYDLAVFGKDLLDLP